MKKIIRISRLAAVALICAVTALLAACSGGSTVEKIPSADKAQASITVAKNELTLDEAIDAALADAGVERENAVFSKAKLDPDDTPHYEIEFSVTVDGMAEEFDYEILVSDGKILKHEREVKSGVTSATETKAEPSKPSSTATGGYISVDDAKAAALAHAKLSADNVKFVKAKFDGNDIKPHYDIEFISGGSEFLGKTLIESGIRDKYNCMVVGLEEGRENLTRVLPTRVFEKGDIIWLVGEEADLQKIQEKS